MACHRRVPDRLLPRIFLTVVGLVCALGGDTSTPEPATAPPAASPPGGGETQPRAFPGAEGFGSLTPGGRGGRVAIVTNLQDAGAGSLRAAVESAGPRIVVFEVAGTITLESPIEVRQPYLTVAGQTAPGGGITLRADSCNGHGVFGIHSHDVVIRFVRFRPGPHECYGEGESSDGLLVAGRSAHHIVVDHSSISWAVDENLSLYSGARDVTFSWNVISEGLAHSTHNEGEHSKGAHLSGWKTYNISFHHNLLAHNNDRNPQPTNPGLADIRNNVVYNYGDNAALASNSKGRPRFNFVGNYYKPGNDSDTEEHVLDVWEGSSQGWAFYVRDNLGPHRDASSDPQSDSVDPAGRSSMVGEPFRTAPVATTSARQAFDDVLAGAGAHVPHRDAVDARVVDEVRSGTGEIIDDPSEVGGWPKLPAAVAPPDRDRDGMPNSWERAHRLNPAVDDSADDRDGDGYTNIENYVNGLACVPRAPSG